jgi:hypothetical protein
MADLSSGKYLVQATPPKIQVLSADGPKTPVTFAC